MDDNCAVAAQTTILNQYLDHQITLDEANYVAFSNGWYSPGFGTSPQDMGNLLEAYGISTHSIDHGTVQQLAQELQQGHRVIVGVNSSQLWDQGPMAEFWNWIIKVFGLDTAQFSPADHAIVVTGIDLSDLHNPQVIINDSGTADGAAHSYPLDRFMDAWENSDFNYVATSTPPSGGGSLDFDIGTFLGWGTTLVASASFGLDPVTAGVAGELVATLVDNFDWDNLLSTI